MNINYEITLKYQKKRNIRILGDLFVKKNKNNFVLIIKGKTFKLISAVKIGMKEYDPIYDEENDTIFIGMKSNEEILEIKLKQIRSVKDISCMFSNCKNLISIENISNWDTENIMNMSFLFHNCSQLTSLPDISNWNISNVRNINNMLSGCSQLLY